MCLKTFDYSIAFYSILIYLTTLEKFKIMSLRHWTEVFGILLSTSGIRRGGGNGLNPPHCPY